VLRGRIRHARGATTEPGGRRQVDDRALPILQHVGNRRPRHPHGAPDVHREDALPDFVRNLTDGLEIVHDAGVVDQTIEAVVGADDLDNLVDVLLNGDIADHGHQVQLRIIGDQDRQAI